MADPRAERAAAKKERVDKNARQRMANAKRAGRGDADDVTPAGVPVDLTRGEVKRGKAGVDGALSIAQKATASLGKFDAKRDGEKPVKEPRGKKRQFQPVVGPRNGDLDRTLKMIHDISQPRAKAPKKGQAEVMDTHDGEVPNSDAVRRKKGRAASGKLKKTTKKRHTK